MLQIEDWDDEQLSVIEARYNQRLLVEAGPGTGKTAVACSRIAHLINDARIAEPNIWMISFTRAAVAEIRSRLFHYVGESAFSIKVATIDSHAWSIHSGHDPAAKLTGTYEENIDRVIELVRCDEEVQEELEVVEHLIVDEAQDLIGIRAHLVETLIGKLNSACGVTVFADSAQAIYGFADDEEIGDVVESSSLMDRLASQQKGFATHRLTTIHRTSSLGLKYIFGKVRESILDGCGAPEGLFARTQKSICHHADQTGLSSNKLGLESVPASSLVLFRTRAEALRHSQFCERPHSLRLSGFGLHLPAWLAICLGDFTDLVISKDDFFSRWAARVESFFVPDYGPTEAWNRLVRSGGNRDGSVDLRMLRSRLSRSNPPLDLCRLDFGLPGPIIGTIHASKGREADNVTMLIPRQVATADPALEADETRILFVGATRAREELRVGQGEKYSGIKLDSGRAVRIGNKGKNVAMVEIGRPGDLSATAIAGRRYSSECKFVESQHYLKHHASAISKMELWADNALQWQHGVVIPESELHVGVMSKAFKNDLWKIANILSDKRGKKLQPRQKIKNVRCLGVRTHVVSENDPEFDLLHPAARTGFLLAPMMASFTNVYFKLKTY